MLLKLKGVKIDNLVQIGHNVEVGENTVIAAQTGVAGSTHIGSNCQIGGQVGFRVISKLQMEQKFKDKVVFLHLLQLQVNPLWVHLPYLTFHS